MSSRWTVVVVDDHSAARAAVAEAVTAQGGLVVGNGNRFDDIVRLAERHRPDVLVSAVDFPDGDGIEASRLVGAASLCPVVLLTSHVDLAVSTRAAEAGVLAFLVKPLRPEELGPTLDVAVCRFREIQAVRRENETLKRTIEGRKLIERAKGILMTRLGLSEPEAFRKIQKTAMDTRKPMTEVAEALLLTEQMAHRTAR